MLVLSEFAGAAPELRTALTVNPHDVDGIAEAIAQGLALPDEEIRRRMRSMRSAVRKHTIHDWARAFMDALAA